jgi:hypothetical protein
MKTGVHNVVIGGAPARVLAYPGDLLVEVTLGHNVTEEEGLVFFWDSVGLHSIDIATLPPEVEVALVSNDARILEVHDPAEEPVDPGYPFSSAVVMPRGWFDRNCTSSHCRMNAG